MNRPTTKDKSASDYIDYLENKLSVYEKSPYAKSYVILLNQYNDMIEQLEIREDVEWDDKQKKDVLVTKGRIDIFGTTRDKEFGLKFFQDSYDLLQQIDKFRSKMTEAERKDADGKPKLKEGSTAEKYIFNK